MSASAAATVANAARKTTNFANQVFKRLNMRQLHFKLFLRKFDFFRLLKLLALML